MKLKEFKEIYQKRNKHWDFSKFKIVCEKCESNRVEFNSDIEIGIGYYEELEKSGGIIIKCYSCGNAVRIDLWDLEERQ